MVTVTAITLIAATAASGPNVLFALLPVLLGGGMLGAVVSYRAQNRKTHADATAILQETYQEGIQDLRDQMASLRDDARGARAEAAEARAAAAGAREEAQKAVQAQYAAEARAAELDADLARAVHKAGEERHALKNEMAALGAKLLLREREIEQLRAEVDTLRSALGDAERRRDQRRRNN